MLRHVAVWHGSQLNHAPRVVHRCCCPVPTTRLNRPAVFSLSLSEHPAGRRGPRQAGGLWHQPGECKAGSDAPLGLAMHVWWLAPH